MSVNQGEITYTVVVFQSDTQFSAIVPDFTLFSSGKTKDEVVEAVRSLTEEAISVYKKRGNKLPTPTSIEVLTERWGGVSVEFLSVIFSV